jgi:hypothetical protein
MMAWEAITVSYGKSTYEAMRKGDKIQVAPAIGTPKNIKIDGKSVEVTDVQLDLRDEFVTLTVSDEAKLEEVSDDEPDEGGDDD